MQHKCHITIYYPWSVYLLYTFAAFRDAGMYTYVHAYVHPSFVSVSL